MSNSEGPRTLCVKVMEDAYEQTGDESDRKGGYWIPEASFAVHLYLTTSNRRESKLGIPPILPLFFLPITATLSSTLH
jgi:hypothetical protein